MVLSLGVETDMAGTMPFIAVFLFLRIVVTGSIGYAELKESVREYNEEVCRKLTADDGVICIVLESRVRVIHGVVVERDEL